MFCIQNKFINPGAIIKPIYSLRIQKNKKEKKRRKINDFVNLAFISFQSSSYQKMLFLNLYLQVICQKYKMDRMKRMEKAPSCCKNVAKIVSCYRFWCYHPTPYPTYFIYLLPHLPHVFVCNYVTIYHVPKCMSAWVATKSLSW